MHQVLQPVREEMAAAMSQLAFPDRAQEAWRYVNTDLLKRAVAFKTGSANPPLELPVHPGLSLQGLEKLPAGEAAQMLKIIKQQASGDYFAALNLSCVEEVQVLKVARGAIMDEAFDLKLAPVAHQRLHVHVGAGARARINIGQVVPMLPALITCETTFHLEANAILELAVQKSSGHAESVLLTGYGFVQQRDSSVKFVHVASGQGLTRMRAHSDLRGENAGIELIGGADLSGTSALHTFMEVHHTVPHCRSRQLFKNILRDAARSSFDGTIFVEKHAQKTVAEQLNNNLLLSAEARAATKPRLNIHADDVICTHGATVGQLDEDEVFYLQARGLPPQRARSLLAYGFLREIVQEIPFAAVRESWDRELAGVYK